jgi:hypothetical protein
MNIALLTKRIHESGKTISPTERLELLKDARIVDQNGVLVSRFVSAQTPKNKKVARTQLEKLGI